MATEHLLKATCPPGLGPGQQFIVQAPNGQQVFATIPSKYPNPVPPNTPIWIRYTPVVAPMPIVMSTETNATPTAADDKAQIVEGKKSTSLPGAPKAEHLVPFAACCCSILTCYKKFPDCLGCYNKGTLTCLECEMLCCKTGMNEEASDGSLCQALAGELECIKPSTCGKLQWQLCCLNCAIAMPCDEEVPCMIAFLGITCVSDYKCVFQACKPMQSAEVGNRA